MERRFPVHLYVYQMVYQEYGLEGNFRLDAVGGNNAAEPFPMA
jgi:hypothetical protein